MLCGRVDRLDTANYIIVGSRYCEAAARRAGRQGNPADGCVAHTRDMAWHPHPWLACARSSSLTHTSLASFRRLAAALPRKPRWQAAGEVWQHVGTNACTSRSGWRMAGGGGWWVTSADRYWKVVVWSQREAVVPVGHVSVSKVRRKRARLLSAVHLVGRVEDYLYLKRPPSLPQPPQPPPGSPSCHGTGCCCDLPGRRASARRLSLSVRRPPFSCSARLVAVGKQARPVARSLGTTPYLPPT